MVLYIKNRVDHKVVDAQAIFATKTDVATINENIAKINENLHTSIHKNELKIAESKTDLLKWLFGLILGSTVAIISTILAVMKMGGW